MTARGLRRLRAALAAGLPLAMLATAGLLALARWPAYWTWIAPEQAPMAFFQAVVLLCAAFSAAVLCLLAALRGAPSREMLIWAVLSAGLLVLMLDDQFYVHQRLRDSYLASLGVGLPWGRPGDYLVAAYAGVGLLFAPLVLRRLRPDRLALGLFVAGVALALTAAIADTFDIQQMSMTTERRVQTLEEVVEGVTGGLLAGALVVHLVDRLAGLARVGAATGACSARSPTS